MRPSKFRLDVVKTASTLIQPVPFCVSRCLSPLFLRSAINSHPSSQSRRLNTSFPKNQQASSLAEEEPVQSSSTSKSTPSTAPSVHHQPEWAPRKITLRDSFYKKEAERTRDERSVQRRAGEMRDATRRRKSMPHFGSPSMERGVDPVDRRALEQDMTPLRLTPSLGRTVFVNQNGGGLQFAFNRLGAKVAADQLRTKARLQRFHERPGLKKKRLVQERKELRFMRGYVKMKDRVRLLVRKGW